MSDVEFELGYFEKVIGGGDGLDQAVIDDLLSKVNLTMINKALSLLWYQTFGTVLFPHDFYFLIIMNKFYFL